MKSNIIEILFLVLATAAGTYFITKYTIESGRQEILRTDTVMVKADTVYKDRPITAKLKAKIDTTFTDSAKGEIADVTARADTAIEKDGSYIKVAYHYPPKNYFEIEADIKEKIVTIIKKVMEYVKVPAPWYDHFIVGAGAVLAAIIGVIFLIN